MSKSLKSGGRYPVLRALAILYMVGAVGAICAGVYYAGWFLFASPNSMGERIGWAAWTMIGTFLTVVSILAVAEMIKLFIDIEHNTRVAAMGASSNGNARGDSAGGRLAGMEEESAEAALIRGH